MGIGKIQERIKQKTRLAKHISQQLTLPLDNDTIRLKIRQSGQLDKEIYSLKKMLEDLHGRKN